MNAIEVKELTKDYPTGFWRKRYRRGLDALTLTVEPGEIFGLLGPNGAGKSTTLKLLMGLIYPTAGTARLLGRPLGDMEAHRRIGYLPEAPYFYDYLTASEFLDYCGRLFGQSKSERCRRVGELLERVGLASAADVALRYYSRGMLQRVGIAQGLINDPDLVFLDEPMLGLDPVGRREVRDLVADLRAKGKTVCFSTHILSDVESLCDRVAILNRGCLHGLGRLDEILPFTAKAAEVLVSRFTPQLKEALENLSDRVRVAGDKLTVRVSDQSLYSALETIRAHQGDLISVNPVRASLEDYFFEEFGTEKVPELAR